MPDVAYTVTAQTLSEELMPNGTFSDVWRINYETPQGVHGYIRVPAALYSAQVVHDSIAADVAKIAAVHQLGTAPPPAPAAG